MLALEINRTIEDTEITKSAECQGTARSKCSIRKVKHFSSKKRRYLLENWLEHLKHITLKRLLQEDLRCFPYEVFKGTSNIQRTEKE